MISPRIFIWFQLFHRTAHDRPDKRQRPGQASWHAAVHQTVPAVFRPAADTAKIMKEAYLVYLMIWSTFLLPYN